MGPGVRGSVQESGLHPGDEGPAGTVGGGGRDTEGTGHRGLPFRPMGRSCVLRSQAICHMWSYLQLYT